jgi:2-polyprenyl-3-methyl-5-hydroxy-6-metoxy-1,4-benzoquinol methylase
MANKRGKKIDKTHLSLDAAVNRGFLHRDYIAHVFRWTHVVKVITRLDHGALKILDVGCGVEQPLIRTMYTSRIYPKIDQGGIYVGVDYNVLTKHPVIEGAVSLNAQIVGEVVFPSTYAEKTSGLGLPDKYDLAVSFEVLEHVEPAGTYAILKGIFDILEDDGIAILSTPCYDEQTGAADNHVNEMSYQGLGSMIESLGFEVVKTYGTFASQKDYLPLMNPEQLRTFEALGHYYDSNVLSIIFAPMFPQASRNCLWELRKPYGMITKKKFPTPAEVSGPNHSSSSEWTDFMNSL